MANVIMWVDRYNFRRFMNGKDFIGWSEKTMGTCIQISVPKTAIVFSEYKYDSMHFECFKKELW